MTLAQEKQRLREEICHAAHQVAQAGWVAANDGNLSARCPDGHVLITPSGLYKGDVTPELLLELTLEGDVVSPGPLPPSSETPMHLAVCITMDMVLLLGGFVPCLPYLPLGTETLAQGVANVQSEAAVLLAHHGAVTWGRDLREAWYRTQALEAYCHQLWLQRQLFEEIPVLELE